MILLQNTETGRSIELTDSELDAIYSAMSDYQDYGDEESELSGNVQSKLYQLNQI
jgi:hypothetical protein